MTNAPACWAFSLTVLGRFAGFGPQPWRCSRQPDRRVWRRVYSFDGLFLLPAGDGIAGKLGIFLQRFLVQGVYIGLFQLALCLCCLCGTASACGCDSPPAPDKRRSPPPPRTCGRFPRPHCPVRFPGSPCGACPERHGQGVSRTAWDNLEGGFFLSSSTSFGGLFAGLRVH